jgi:hypothetical protein
MTDVNETAAALAHGVLRAYRGALGEEPGPAWLDLDAGEREAQREAVAGLRKSVEDVGAPEARHRRWLAARAADGWRWAEGEDRARRLSPCMRPWAALAPEQRAKDALWRAAVEGALAMLAGPPVAVAVEVEAVETEAEPDNPAVPFAVGGAPETVPSGQPSRAERRAQRKGR